MRLNKFTVKVKRSHGEWAAVAYINGKRNEALTYYSGGNSADHKLDAETTASAMRAQYEKHRKAMDRSIKALGYADMLEKEV